MIKLVPYDKAWPAMFEAEAGQIRRALHGLALRVEHVGSTAVPGLSAKPVIDIQVSVACLNPFETYLWLLGPLGYVHVSLGEFDRVYPFFQKPAEWPCTHHVHLCESGGEQEARHLAFRDHLRNHPEVARQYLELKRPHVSTEQRMSHAKTTPWRKAISSRRFLQRQCEARACAVAPNPSTSAPGRLQTQLQLSFGL
jgi:GrpB-like predicted nucleotidyltransferase (UPF0157 family)